MKIATLLFTYHRSYHTEQVLLSLKNNTVLPEKLFIFQDGLKPDEDDCEWKKVNELIQKIDWCENEIIISDYNKGLAASIISGVNYALEEYDAVIVLEDDCVSSQSFMQFMIQGLTQYKKNEKVYSISGYCWPLALKQNEYDAFCCGRVSTLGWGTWKDRWAKFNRDNSIIKRLKANQTESRNLAAWGKDMETMLFGTIMGQFDSWGVYWALNIIENGGICINPYKSLIKHIGWDGTGTNTVKSDKRESNFSDDLVVEFRLPDETIVLESTEEVFVRLYGNYTSLNQQEVSKENVLIYGLGNFYFQNERTVCENYHIEAFIDQRKHGWFAGKKIIKLRDAQKYTYDKIIIMIWDIQECINIARELISQGISYEQIVLGNSLYGRYNQNIDRIAILPDGNLSVTVDGITVKVRSKDEFNNAYEVLVDHTYHYYINNNKKDVVLDVGMNIGDASLYFLANERVEKVYAYEPFKETFMAARDNLKEYLDEPNRLEMFRYGISNENSRRIVGFNANMTCGQSTIVDVREKAYAWYKKVGLAKSQDEEEESIEVKDVAEVFLPIIQNHPECNIVLKMDCEGEEYGIMEELSEKGILNMISFIMLEWHYKGKDSLLTCLEKSGFSYWCNDKTKDMGLIYAYRETISD